MNRGTQHLFLRMSYLKDEWSLALQSNMVKKTDHEKSLIQRQINTTDKEIDQLVYELYGLTDKEIHIVEGAANG